MGRLDRSLNRLLASLAAGLAGSGDDSIRVHLGDWPEATAECLGILRGVGLLADAEPERELICEGCERSCMMEVALRAGANGAKPVGFIVCDKRDDIGRVPVEVDRLRTWQFSMEQVAAMAANLLRAAEPPRPADSGKACHLGAVVVGGRAVEAALCRRAEDAPIGCGLGIVLDPTGILAGACVGLAQLVRFADHRLTLDKSPLRTALAAQVGDTRIACEIGFERGEIVLINHVTGERRGLARPDFDSVNDNIFQRLFENPERKFSLPELRNVADKRDLNDLHKIPENLHFHGPLKKLFFRVSKDAIVFSRTATLGQMTTLGIDPKRI